VDDLISVCGDEEDRNLRNAWTAQPNGLITFPVETGGHELHEEPPLDDRLKSFPTFTSSPFVTYNTPP
jgi:hypothetical protein